VKGEVSVEIRWLPFRLDPDRREEYAPRSRARPCRASASGEVEADFESDAVDRERRALPELERRQFPTPRVLTAAPSAFITSSDG